MYVNQNEYTKALKYYNRVLTNDSLKSQNVGSYARVLDNRAYCKFLMKLYTLEIV
jgi:two-component system NarL family sensor kinase